MIKVMEFPCYEENVGTVEIQSQTHHSAYLGTWIKKIIMVGCWYRMSRQLIMVEAYKQSKFWIK